MTSNCSCMNSCNDKISIPLFSNKELQNSIKRDTIKLEEEIFQRRFNMPFIQSKVSVSLTDTQKENISIEHSLIGFGQKENIKSKLGKAISLIPGKSEQWLMVEIKDNCCLYFQGNQDAPTAFVEVKIFGKASSQVYDSLTNEICNILNTELSIPKNRIYVKYEEVANWGWNGGNF